ncbi:MAG: aspartyl protease family protein [Alphaproteobacteria bacterium]|nr:aspartyl protease family protein [Alphaproteobacteria bacterium]
MRIHAIAVLNAFAVLAALAAFFVSAAAGDAAAQTCGLSLMASLDMTMLPDGRFTVPVTLNGVSHQFLVDTAGVFSEISDSAAQKLGLKETEAGTFLYGASGKLKLGAATVTSFKVGNNEARNFHIAVRHLPADAPAPPKEQTKTEAETDGLLAPDFLSLFDVEIDTAKKKANLFSQDHCPGKVVYWTRGGYADLPFRFTSGAIMSTPHIQLRMTLDGHDVSAALDTGADGSYLRKRSAVQIFGVDETSPGVSKVADSPDAYPVYRKQFGSLTLGGLTVQNPVVYIFPGKEEDAFRMEHSEKSRDDPIYGSSLAPEDFTLGMNVLSKLHLYIAYKEKKVYITDADAK